MGGHAAPAEGDPVRAVEIRTTAMPSFETPQTGVPGPETDQALPELADVVLDMKRLAEMPTPDLIAGLAPLVAGYRAWIERQEAAIGDSARHLSAYGADAAEVVRIARRAADRIERGIELLAADESAVASFRFANRAMYLQRVHTMAVEERGRDSALALEDALARVATPDNHSWRPFQLAFVLLNLPALANPQHPERADGSSALADLLWFPTGGGKTEAYLGLTAFILATRRLQPALGGLDPHAGVAVIMRYTLRLLTIQQFQRAATLICAC